MHSRLSDQLRLPSPLYKTNPSMPPLTKHLNITIPHVNAINEKISFYIEGVHPKLILDDSQTTNIDNHRHLGFTIHRALWDQHGKYLGNNFPQPTNRAHTASFISTKLIKSTTPQNQNYIPPCLGIVINHDEPHFTTIFQAIMEICVTNNTPIYLFSVHNTFAITLHAVPQNQYDRTSLVHRITQQNKIQTSPTYKIVRNIKVKYNFLLDPKNSTAIVSGIQDCTAVFPHFDTNGSIYLTIIFNSTRETTFYTTTTVTTLLTSVLEHVVDTTHHKQINHPQPQQQPQQQRPTPTSQSHYQTNTPRNTHATRVKLEKQSDKSTTNFRPANQHLLSRMHPSNKFYALANAAGGIAVCNIYPYENFDDNLRPTIDGVSFNRHKAFDTHHEALQFMILFYPHINSPADLDDMNQNCCSNTSNLNNPSPLIREWIDSYTHATQRGPRNNQTEFYHFDDLPEKAKLLRRACDKRRTDLNLPITAGYTFRPGDPIHTYTTSTQYETNLIDDTNSLHVSKPPSNITIPSPTFPTQPTNKPTTQQINPYNDLNTTDDKLAH